MSGNSDGRSDADGGPPAEANAGALQAATGEAHRTLDEQLDTLEDIDGKAMQLLQFSVGLVGVLVSVLSITGVPAGGGTPYLSGGLALLVAGAIVAGVTYTVSPRVAGVGPTDLERAAESDSETAFRRTLVRSYADWIGFNAVANARAALLITVAVLLVVAGVLGLSLGVVGMLTGSVPLVVVAVAVLGFLAAVYGAGVHRQVARLRAAAPPGGRGGPALPSSEPADRFEGQLCHTGDVGERDRSTDEGGTQGEATEADG